MKYLDVDRIERANNVFQNMYFTEENR